MLKISTILPLGATASINLDSIRTEFLRRTKLYYNPYLFLSNSVAAGNIQADGIILQANLTADEATVLNYLYVNYDSLITSTPTGLQGHINAIDAINNGIFGSITGIGFRRRFTVTPFGNAIHKLFGYENHFRSNGTKGVWLASQLNIKTCPYCNAQYTLIVPTSASRFLAKFQFDHFFSKKRFPYLSLSLYNLIPSCAPCNLSKKDTLTNLSDYYHPYHNNLAYRGMFRASFPVELRKISIGQVKRIPINIRFRPRYAAFNNMINLHNGLYHIEPIYNRHSDIVQDLMVKAILRNSSFKKDIMEIQGLFEGDESLYKRYLLGNYGITEEISERPLSKLTQDIAKQFEIIH